MMTVLMLEVILERIRGVRHYSDSKEGGISTSCQGTHIPERRISKKKKEGPEVDHMVGMDEIIFQVC